MPVTSPPAELFHYTSADAAIGILSDGVIRASMVHYMNDGQEFTYALDLLRELLEEEHEAGRCDTDAVRVCNEYLAAVRPLALFAFSLSGNGDLLSQWRAYCPADGGYALQFDTDALTKTSSATRFSFVQCEYDRDRQRDLLRPVLADMIQSAAALGQEGRGFQLHEVITQKLGIIGVAMKHHSFWEEKEWRLVATLGAFEPPKYRSRRGLIVPYLEIPITGGDRFPIPAVVVGPHPHPDLAGMALRLLSAQARGWPVKVRHADTPFRNLG